MQCGSTEGSAESLGSGIACHLGIPGVVLARLFHGSNFFSALTHFSRHNGIGEQESMDLFSMISDKNPILYFRNRQKIIRLW